MTTQVKAQRRVIVIKNVTCNHFVPDSTVLYQSDLSTVRVIKVKAQIALTQAQAAGFIENDEFLLKTNRLATAEEEQTTPLLILNCFLQHLIVPDGFFPCLVEVPVVSSAGKPKKKSAE